MRGLRRAWTVAIAFAVLVIACGSFSPAMALACKVHDATHHGAMTGHHQHDGKGKTGMPTADCGMACVVVAPTAPFAVSGLAPSPPAFWSVDSTLAGARTAPDPPPPRTS